MTAEVLDETLPGFDSGRREEITKWGVRYEWPTRRVEPADDRAHAEERAEFARSMGHRATVVCRQRVIYTGRWTDARHQGADNPTDSPEETR